MPGKWTDQAERDLIFAVLASHTGGDLKVKVSWDTVKDQMHAWGHTDFTKEALNQRWSKTIVKDFKEGKGDDSFGASAKDTAAGGGGDTPAVRKRKAPTPRKTPKSAAGGAPRQDAEDDDEAKEENAGDEQHAKKPADAPMPKKRKPSAKNTPKAEPKAKPEPKKEAKSASIFGNGVKREDADEV